MPPDEVLNYLRAPWPRYITLGDVVLNIAAYLPLGVLLFAALRPRLPPSAAFGVAVLLAAALSLACESAQMFLPTRIASNLDLLTNSAGAGTGALVAWILTLPMLANHPLAVLRRRMVRTDELGDCGLIVVGLWVLAQFHIATLALGSGDFREALHVTPLFAHTPQLYLLAETGVVALTLVAIGLLVSLLLLPQRSVLPATALTLALALTVKAVTAATLTRAAYWLQWLTPGVVAGTAGGGMLLAALLQLTHAVRALVAAICLIAVVVIVNVTPENPYQAVPVFLLSPQPTHLANFGLIVRALSQLWPFAALIFLLAAARAERAAAH